jgi:hypothetical protein
LEAFVPDSRGWIGRRFSYEQPDVWLSDAASLWFYRIEIFSSEVDEVNLDGVWIRKLVSADVDTLRGCEKQTGLASGFFASSLVGPPWHEVVNDRWPWVIVVPVDAAQFDSARFRADLMVGAVLSALRLTDGSFFFILGPTTCQPGVPGSIRGQFGLLPKDADLEIPEEDKFHLSKDSLTTLLRIWQGQLTVADPRLSLALRRFNLAYERGNYDDALIDLWIGLEGLFSDSGTDITYKAAMRIAYYLEQEPKRRSELFRVAKDSYGSRSGLVHGKPPEDLKEARSVAQDALRRSLTRALLEQAVPEPHALDDVIAAGGAPSPSTNPPEAPPGPGS